MCVYSKEDQGIIQREETTQKTTSHTKFKKSRYNFKTESDAGVRLFNARSGAVLDLSSADPHFHKFQEIWRQRTFLLSDHEWLPALAECGFLIPQKEDEVSDYIGSFEGKRINSDYLNLILMPTEECNFRCVYCYESFLNREMSHDIQDALKRLILSAALRVHIFFIEWFGGEPLLGIDVIREISGYSINVANQYGISYKAAMTTNGYLLSPEVFEEAVNEWRIGRFQITIDGPKTFHDERRHLISGEPTFDVVISNLEYVARSSFPNFIYIIRMNIDRDNLHTLREFANLIKDIVGDDHRARFFARPAWGKSSFELLTSVEVRDLQREMVEICRSVGLHLYDPDLFLNPQVGMCYAADPHCFVIGSNGSVYKCTSDFELEENLVGRLAPDGTLALDRRKLGLWVDSMIGKFQECQRCVVLPLCNCSHCPKTHIVYPENEKAGGVPPCVPYKNQIKLLLKAAQ